MAAIEAAEVSTPQLSNSDHRNPPTWGSLDRNCSSCVIQVALSPPDSTEPTSLRMTGLPQCWLEISASVDEKIWDGVVQALGVVPKVAVSPKLYPSSPTASTYAEPGYSVVRSDVAPPEPFGHQTHCTFVAPAATNTSWM